MLRETHTSSVTEDQIDHLGHMNVRYYGVNAMAGTKALLAELPGWDARPFLVADTYTRHHREQLLGTELVVRSAVLDADDRTLRLHHELAAADSGELAATFVHGLHALDADGRPAPLPDAVVAAASAGGFELPDYASPRTIDLGADLSAAAPSFDDLDGRHLAMRHTRTVLEDELDEQGRYRVDLAPMLTWGGEPVDPDPSEILAETSAGVLMGWAMMETRIQIDGLPGRGDRIQSFGATVALADKTTHRVHWVFDVDSKALLTTFESVSLAFDVRGRRAMSIPEGYRAKEQDRLQPDLAPRALA